MRLAINPMCRDEVEDEYMYYKPYFDQLGVDIHDMVWIDDKCILNINDALLDLRQKPEGCEYEFREMFIRALDRALYRILPYQEYRAHDLLEIAKRAYWGRTLGFGL